MPNLINRALQLFKNTEKSAETPPELSFHDLIEDAWYGSIHVNATKAFSFYRKSSAISTAVDLIASKIETIMPVIDRGGEIQDRDEITDFLVRPNDDAMWRNFIGHAARNFLLTGNTYFLGLGTLSRPPLEVYSASPMNAHPSSNLGNGLVDRYDFAGLLAAGSFHREDRPPPGGGVRFVNGTLWQLYHLKGYTTRVENLVGDSPIESILSEIQQHISGGKHNEAMLRNGGRLSLLFIVKEFLGDKNFRTMAERLREQFGGAHNAGKVATISGKDLDVKEMGVNNKDMDFVNLTEITKAAIFSRYNIPLPLITSTRQTLNNYGTAIEALYDEAVLPLADILFEALTDFLLPRWGRDPRAERLTYNPKSITALNERRLRELKEESSLNALTLNEVRAKLPNTPQMPGADVVFAPASLVPIAGDGIDLAAERQDDREALEEARARMEEQLGAGDEDETAAEDGADDETEE